MGSDDGQVTPLHLFGVSGSVKNTVNNVIGALTSGLNAHSLAVSVSRDGACLVLMATGKVI